MNSWPAHTGSWVLALLPSGPASGNPSVRRGGAPPVLPPDADGAPPDPGVDGLISPIEELPHAPKRHSETRAARGKGWLPGKCMSRPNDGCGKKPSIRGRRSSTPLSAGEG